MNASYINELFNTLKMKDADTAYAGHIKTHMRLNDITFAELNFTEEEFKAEERRACVGYINELFNTLKMKDADTSYAGHIKTHMRLSDITFAELNFTEEEFKAEERRACVGYINELFNTLKMKDADTSYAGHIKTHMRLSDITFAELNFTEEEFKAEERRACVGYINELFNTLKMKDADTSYAGHIKTHMRLSDITFAELNFTEEEFNSVVNCVNA